MKQAIALLAGFGYLVLLIEAIKVAVAWWRGDSGDFGALSWLTLACLPPLAWIWWQHLSPFGRGRGHCLLPENDPAKRENGT